MAIRRASDEFALNRKRITAAFPKLDLDQVWILHIGRTPPPLWELLLGAAFGFGCLAGAIWLVLPKRSREDSTSQSA